MVWVPGSMKKAEPDQTKITYFGRTYTFYKAYAAKSEAEETAKKMRRRLHPDYPGHIMCAAVIDRGDGIQKSKRYGIFIAKGSKSTVRHSMKKYYVGVKGRKREVFTASTTPTAGSHGDRFTYVIGPFRSKKGAEYMKEYGKGDNPHCRTVAEAERLARRQNLR